MLHYENIETIPSVAPSPESIRKLKPLFVQNEVVIFLCLKLNSSTASVMWIFLSSQQIVQKNAAFSIRNRFRFYISFLGGKKLIAVSSLLLREVTDANGICRQQQQRV